MLITVLAGLLVRLVIAEDCSPITLLIAASFKAVSIPSVDSNAEILF